MLIQSGRGGGPCGLTSIWWLLWSLRPLYSGIGGYSIRTLSSGKQSGDISSLWGLELLLAGLTWTLVTKYLLSFFLSFRLWSWESFPSWCSRETTKRTSWIVRLNNYLSGCKWFTIVYDFLLHSWTVEWISWSGVGYLARRGRILDEY